MQKSAVLIILGVFAVVAIIYFSFDGIAPNRDFPGAENVHIDKTWKLPILLEEVSGISWIDEERIACVEDEEAIIFIFNTKTSLIEKQIAFGEDGDYEGVTVAEKDAYVLRSDGTIFEVQNFLQDSIVINEYKTGLPPEFNFEGICYDKRKNRLLLAIKDRDDKVSKPIYSFNLSTKKVEENPAFEIPFNATQFKVLNQEINHQIIRPSEVAIHPKNGDIYVLEGTNPKLLILNSKGNIKKLHILKEEQFAQPEGLTFDAAGNLYISNEGAGGLGNILQVNLNKKPE